MPVERADAARADHSIDRVGRAGEHRFHRSITAIANPAIQIALDRMMLDESAEADALNAAANDHMLDDARIVHVYVPVIAASPITQL
jgi:hypothetical protein